MTRTRIKVCGMTDVTQVEQAVALGVDAIGMILHADSPRQISLDEAVAIRKVVPEFVSLVGVFVDAPDSKVKQYVEEAELDIIQFHGQEDTTRLQAHACRHIKAIRAQSAEQVKRSIELYPDTRTFLFDPFVDGQHGGTGKLLDPSVWPRETNSPHRFILAGGLSEKNVFDRIRLLRPFAVDVNSGIEDGPGHKNINRLQEFINQVRDADAE